jgi:hypothetical protein
MNFEQTITDITFTLETSGFSTTERRDNYRKFQSRYIAIVVSYSPLEHSFSVFTGRNNEEMNELTDRVYLNVFGINFQQMIGETFPKQFIHFLENEGRGIVVNDMAK